MHRDPLLRPRILLACTPDDEPVLRIALAGLDAEVVGAHAHDEALREIARGIDLVVCSLRFDESRMFDFIAEVGRERPRLPFICCRVLESHLPERALRAAFAAAGHLGAVAVVNLPELVRHVGALRARADLRETVRAQVHGAAQASMT